MEIINNGSKKPITVWLTNEEQEQLDLHQLTAQIRKSVQDPKRKVVYFLSGETDLYQATEDLLIENIKPH
ncbi:MAG: hypothetical protein J6U16_06060 [Ruminococcus sp.]|nr:hypothetical protein [Ruminococcus sp.]